MTVLPTLQTPRLGLRPFALSDAPAFTAYHNDPQVAEFQGWDLPYQLEWAEAHAREMEAAPLLSAAWATLMLSKLSGDVLGHLAVRLTAYRTAEVGYTLARAHWGQGYAHEGLLALLGWLFGPAGLHRVHASLDPRNVRSGALLRRCGFRYEGCSVSAYWHRGHWSDDAHYALLDTEWTEKQR